MISDFISTLKFYFKNVCNNNNTYFFLNSRLLFVRNDSFQSTALFLGRKADKCVSQIVTLPVSELKKNVLPLFIYFKNIYSSVLNVLLITAVAQSPSLTCPVNLTRS